MDIRGIRFPGFMAFARFSLLVPIFHCQSVLVSRFWFLVSRETALGDLRHQGSKLHTTRNQKPETPPRAIVFLSSIAALS